ncbi:MAG: heavy metal-binding domain-containing protein, partial [Micropepsaceae bacterium]
MQIRIARCLEKFCAKPAPYLDGDGRSLHVPPAIAPARPSAATNVEYTCPMHPEVVQIGPGTCPKCGMALEPRVATPEAQEDHELRDMRRRFWGSLVVTLPL